MISDGAVVDGKYRIVRPLGGGAMGKVYLAEKVSTHERFAIKFIHDYLVSDETYYARFEREINALRGIRHPHVVATYDWKLPERGKAGSAYIVMEYLPGESMQQALMRPQPMPLEVVLRVMLQVLDGLSTVHALGVIHRDLSPANIFLADGDPQYPSTKIVDFGLAKGEAASSASDSQGGVTQDGAVLGRAAYASPEMFLGRELDPRADIFACGMILYRTLAGRFPYRETKTELMWVERYSQRHEEGRPYPAARSYRPTIPAAVDQIISQAIRKRPHERYQSAELMQRDLLKVEELLRLTPRLEPSVQIGPPALPESLPMPSTTRVEVPPGAPPSADSGSPTPGPSLGPAGVPTATNWLGVDGSSRGSGGTAPNWSARHPRVRLAIAGALVAVGLLSVVLALALRGGSAGTSALRPGSADAGAAAVEERDAAAKVAVATQDAVAETAPRTADAGHTESTDAVDAARGDEGVSAANDGADAMDTAEAVDAAPAQVSITLDGMPPEAEAFVGDVKAQNGVAVVPRSETPVHVLVKAPGFRDFDEQLTPFEDPFFFVTMEPAAAPAADAGAVVVRDAGTTTVRRDAGGTTTVRRDAGGTTPRADAGTADRREAGGTTTVRRDAGGTTPRRDGGLGIIINYDEP
jgi:serine/threonine protein kinase